DVSLDLVVGEGRGGKRRQRQRVLLDESRYGKPHRRTHGDAGNSTAPKHSVVARGVRARPGEADVARAAEPGQIVSLDERARRAKVDGFREAAVKAIATNGQVVHSQGEYALPAHRCDVERPPGLKDEPLDDC